MSVNPSCRYSGLALVRYLGVDFIFDPALEFILSCCFQVKIKRGNHYVFFITKGMIIIITCRFNFTCFPFSSCSKSSQNSSACSIATFIKCLFLPVALPALLMTFNFFHPESSSLASLHSIVCPGLGSSIFLWLEFCLGSPFLTVWCCLTWSFRVPNSSTLFSPKIEMSEVSFGPTCEVVGSAKDSLSEEFWYTTGWGTRRQGCTLTYVPPCLTRTCHPITDSWPSHLSQRFLL